MGYVYLIGEVGNDGKYKIGSTRAKKVETRLKQLQTGNPSQLYIKDSFETEHPFKLEKMLHNKYKLQNINNEWFSLSLEDINNFESVCNNFEDIIIALKDNPFF